ncbi:UNVERIFIED_CONTAM: hypothetical protein NCL1_35043 [Trichonephila clavipes]
MSHLSHKNNDANFHAREKSYTFTLGNSPPSLGESAGSKSTLLRGLSIAFLSLIGTQTVPGSPQFGFRRTSWSPYRFPSIAEGTSQRLPQKSSLFFGLSRYPYILSLLPSLA